MAEATIFSKNCNISAMGWLILTKFGIVKCIGPPSPLANKILQFILKIQVDGLLPVSYTHLTLPTIYSV